MKKGLLFFTLLLAAPLAFAQNTLTAEALWKLGRVSPLGISKDGKSVIYRVTTPSVAENKSTGKIYILPVDGGSATEIQDAGSLLKNDRVSADGKYVIYDEKVKLSKVLAKDFYPELEKATVQIHEGLDYRHWDTYSDGTYNHVFYRENKEGAAGTDIMKDQPYHSPTMPFGGSEDYTWNPDGTKILYVSKKQAGTAYANSTNTDIYEYDLAGGTTRNLTESNPGYDTHPVYSPQGVLTWLQMKRDGYEADKNDIIVDIKGRHLNLTSGWDGTVNDFKWSEDGKKIYFTAPVGGTIQLFEVNYPGLTKIAIQVRQLTEGDFDVTGIVGFSGDRVIVTRTDFNHAAEIFSYDLKSKAWKQLSHVNTGYYQNISLSKWEKRWVNTTDGKKMLVWVVFPPDFDPAKKYPTLLYLQGGPQGALTQFYSFRWNFQLMAAQGYIVVAPNRRGMPGHGVEWNEEISKDWGGQVMKDYLAAIDDVAGENYVDKARLGAVGASYGGYSAYYLAGIHENRFKTFIAHAGVFNLESMYGTTEEMFFVNWDLGGPYWDKTNAAARKTYEQFNPIRHVDKWNAPMLVIHGEKDYRVPIGQGQEAFQVLQQKGIRSRFVYFTDENHWILKPQNAIVWQNEFFRWLKETL
ncbi:MAG: S9 family peptidase [Leadbetterella sp.]|nr:S9 family peptidase [Leadbetterella sp.]